MAVTKTARTLQSSASNAAGATATGTGVSLATALGIHVTAKITNGATGPTLPCSVTLETSPDGSAWKFFAQATADLGNNAVTEFAFDVPRTAMNVRSVFTGNTGQAVTVEAFGQELTTV